MIVQKELVAIYDYEVPVPEDPFSLMNVPESEAYPACNLSGN